MAIASMIAGVLGLSVIFVPFVGFIPGFAVATPGLVIGVLAHRRSQSQRKIAVIGIVLCTLAFVGAIVNLALSLMWIPWLIW